MSKSIELFFSGAQALGVAQQDVNASLGGYPSNTPIPKNQINSLFRELSALDLKGKEAETIAIFVKNTGTENITELELSAMYSQVLGVPDSYCKFEFALSLPNEAGFIELIGSNKEFPYYAEFFEPVVRRADAIVKILTAGEEDDEITFLGQEVTLTGNTIESLIADIIAQNPSDSQYNIQKFNDTSLYVESTYADTNLIELVTPGDATIDTVSFSGGVDESYDLLDADLLPNKYLGLWVRRTVRADVASCDSVGKPTKENLEVNFSF